MGSEKFSTTIFATEEDEIVGENAWKERDAEKSGKTGGNGFSREDLMGDKERELELVRRAEEEARSGTLGRDIGIGGSVSVGGGIPSSMRVQMPADEDAKAALTGLQAGGLVQLVSHYIPLFELFPVTDKLMVQVVDVKTETLKLAGSESGVDPNSVQSHISPSSPQYTYYHYPDSDAVIFIYTCPSGSKIKERMLFASSRNNALAIAGEQGLKIAKKVCIASASLNIKYHSLTSHRSRRSVPMRSPEIDCVRKFSRRRTKDRSAGSPDLRDPAGKSESTCSIDSMEVDRELHISYRCGRRP